MTAVYDTAIVGGGFSGLATAANIVREAKTPTSIAVVCREPQGVFGPAYSTPRQEHLLNVHAKGMGLFADNHRHFLEWVHVQGIKAKPDEFLPRPLYNRYLKSVLTDTRALAKQKNIVFDWFQGEVEDIENHDEYLALKSGDDIIPAHNIVLAIGNSLKAKEDSGPESLVTQPWHYDFSRLGTVQKKIAIIGSGLTAADTIISILDSGWSGEITCISGNAALPRSHIEHYDTTKRLHYNGEKFISHRLSQIMQDLRREVKNGHDWHYVIDSLRPLTQDIWRSLSETDRQRLSSKYFSVWNIRRHRYAPHIGARIDDALKTGRLKMVKARVNGAAEAGKGVRLELAGKPPVDFNLAFKCTGVNYNIDINPLLKKLEEKAMVKPMPRRNGLRVSDSFMAWKKKPNAIYALGAPLFGQLFETTAVPELREQALSIAKTITSELARAAAARL